MSTSKKKPSGSRALQVALLVVLLVAASRLQACDAASGFCASKCAVRCGRASAKKKGPACMKHCGQCCPCYRDILTAGPRKGPKCP